MDNSTILTAARGGHESDLYLTLAVEADEIFFVHSPDDRATMSACRIGAMVVHLDGDGLRAHGHSDVDVAHACLGRAEGLAVQFGWIRTDMDRDAMLSALAAEGIVPDTGPGVPDAVLADGQAVIYVN